MIPYCRYTGVGLIPWSPLARSPHPPLVRPFNEAGGNRHTLEEVAKKLGKSMAAVAVA